MASKKNEDRFAIRTHMGKHTPVEYYGVFDGHAGNDVSDYCSFKFHEILVRRLDEEVRGSVGKVVKAPLKKGAFNARVFGADNSVNGDDVESAIRVCMCVYVCERMLEGMGGGYCEYIFIYTQECVCQRESELTIVIDITIETLNSSLTLLIGCVCCYL